MRAALAALLLLAAAAPARAACPPVPPPPAADRPTGTARADAYVRAVAAASPVVRSAVAGASVQGRPLRYAVVSALSAARLRAGLARLRAVRAGHADSAGDAPAVVWIAGSVHGNEPSGTDADLRLLHELARRCRDPLLRRLAIVVLPLQNPDGHEAEIRVNANGFDLNRDWLTATQPETQARLGALLNLPPLVFADQHEQDDSSFFFPPYASPLFHELPHAAVAAEREILGPALRRAFARRRIAATSGEGFDLLYPGYGDSATTLLFGAAGMTFEAGAERPYRRRVEAQLVAARTTIAAVDRHRGALLRAWTASFAEAEDQGADGVLQGRPGEVRGYALGARSEPLVRLLLSEGVRVRQLVAAAPVAAFRPYAAAGATARATGAAAAPRAAAAPATLPAGTYLVPSAQPLKHWVQAVLGTSAFARGPSLDVGAWSRPPLMGIEGGVIASALPDAPPAPLPPAAGPGPLTGRRIALLADPAADAPVPLGAEAPSAGTSWARWVLAQRLGARVELVDGTALANGALAGVSALIVADGSAATLTPPALQAIASYVTGGGTFVGWRTRGIAIAHAAGLTAATASAAPEDAIPGAAVAVGSTVVLDVDDPIVNGGHAVASYGPVVSGWTSASPTGRTAIVDERPGAGRALLFAFDPTFRGSTEGAEALLTAALA